ncbi:MAG: hypothetical protein ACREKH_13750, partial [Candidatus Rokuibacteriota bacterium]
GRHTLPGGAGQFVAQRTGATHFHPEVPPVRRARTLGWWDVRGEQKEAGDRSTRSPASGFFWGPVDR